MHTSIRLASTYKAVDSLILVTDSKSGLPSGLLSKEENSFVQKELKADLPAPQEERRSSLVGGHA